MERPKVILIVCDTLRKDILEIYGGDAKTPNIRKLAEDSMVYYNCITPSPWTFPSHVSLFTGLNVGSHGIHETLHGEKKVVNCISLNQKLGSERIMDYLNGIGYKTIGISNNMMVSRFTNFDIGFSEFFNVDVDPRHGNKEWKNAEQVGKGVFQVAKNLLKKGSVSEFVRYAKAYYKFKSDSKAINYPLNKGASLTNNILLNKKLDGDFFLFLNLMEAHEPYKYYSFKDIIDDLTGVKQISERKVELLKEQYQISVEFLDKNLGELFQILKDRDLYDNTMIIITSDHGQAFREHGYMFHGTYLYEEIVRAPLIIKYPKGKKFRVRKGYQSLSNIFDLIRDIINGKDDSKLTKQSAISESFGFNGDLPKLYNNRKGYFESKHQKIRKSIYKSDFKLTVNFTDGVIEEFLRNGKEANRKSHKAVISKLLDELKKLDKDSSFKMPDA